MNYSNLFIDNENDSGDENWKVGIHAGVFAKIPLVENVLAIQPELLYSSRGSKIAYDDPLGDDGELRLNFNYLDLPVVAVLNVGPINVQAGVYGGYLLGANVKTLDEDGDSDELLDLNENEFQQIDFGLVGGVGLDIDHFHLGVRYNYGLQKIGDEGGYLTDDVRHQNAQVFVGFTL